MNRLVFSVVLAVVSVVVASGQRATEARLEQALDQWDAGDYVEALTGFQAVLAAGGDDTVFERIALATGELFEVIELAPDGRSVRFSPGGRYALFEVGSGRSTVTHVIDLEDPARRTLDIPATGVVVSPGDTEAAFLRVRPTPEIVALQEELARATGQPSPDRQAIGEIQRKLRQLEIQNTELIVRDLASGREQVVPDGGLAKVSLAFSADGREVYVVGAQGREIVATDIYAINSASGALRALTAGPGFKTSPLVVAGGRYLVYTVSRTSPLAAAGGIGGGGRGAGAGGAEAELAVLHLADRTTTTFKGWGPAVSADGSTLAFLSLAETGRAIQVVKLSGDLKPKAIKIAATDPMVSVAVSPDGSRVAFDMPYTRNTEIFVIGSDGTGEIRVSREIQPDRAPRFVDATRLIAIKGEPRHSRSYLYDLASGRRIRLFHNNTVRTIAPEYEWAVSPGHGRLLIVTERDGDTISPERGVYLLDLNRRITREALLKRLAAQLAEERALRAKAEAQFAPVAQAIRRITAQVSIRRIYEYEAALFDFDSKYITQPGNKQAAEYLFRMFESFGYKPEFQTFMARGNIETSNVLATLKGLENPELVYVLSSHFDSNQRGPGADDNSSATAVLLETARVMAASPLPATVIFAAFTGEEAGLLGSREFVRQAVEKKMKLVGALNNDMIGWTNDHRLDNTIRYSNAGIRDLQHGASFLFSKMITYDAKYYRATDAAAYFEAYGDIVGGFGSYPVLGNPYYHQPTDLLDTVNHQLLYEATKANVASIVRLAYGPSRITGLKAEWPAGQPISVVWTPSPEKGVVRYRVQYGPAGKPPLATVAVVQPRVTIPTTALPPQTPVEIAVTALTSRGFESWDAARATVAPPK